MIKKEQHKAYMASQPTRLESAGGRPCWHCGNQINTNDDEYYVINKKIYGDWLPLFFHQHCFLSVAGESYNIETYGGE
jgi:hypothetical protein